MLPHFASQCRLGALTGPILVAVEGFNWYAYSTQTFVVDQPVVYVKVPKFVNQRLQNAVSLLQQAGLALGTVSGATGFNLIVISQSPAAGASVPRGSSVNLVDATAPSGFSSVTLLNKLADGHSVYVWLYNEATSQWAIQNSGGLLAFGASATFSPQNGIAYVVEAIDPTWCGGANDPTMSIASTGLKALWGLPVAPPTMVK
jgi:hypothetical protein